MPTNYPEFTANLNVDSISLVSAESRRVSFDEFKSGGAEVSFAVDVDDKDPLKSKTKVNVRLFDGESEDDLYLGSSEYRLLLSSDDELPESPETFRQVAALALRLTFPYHRAKISEAISDVGLPPYFLPLVSDEKWLGIVDEAEVANEQGKEEVPSE